MKLFAALLACLCLLEACKFPASAGKTTSSPTVSPSPIVTSTPPPTGTSAATCTDNALSASPFASGSGTSNDPYVICTAAQLLQVGKYLSSSFVLAADIDLSASDWTSPIGFAQSQQNFSGLFDGQNHTISNLHSSAFQDSVGLFYISSGTIQNLNRQTFPFPQCGRAEAWHGQTPAKSSTALFR